MTHGAKISAGDVTIGMLGSVAGDMGLAMVRLDRAAKAIEDGHPLVAGNVEIDLIQPGWADFSVPTKDAVK